MMLMNIQYILPAFQALADRGGYLNVRGRFVKNVLFEQKKIKL